MSAGDAGPRLPRIASYADRLSVSPGETLSVMVSTAAAVYRSSVVRLIGGETDREGGGFIEIPVEGIPGRRHPGRVQGFPRGSFVAVADQPALRSADSFTIQAWLRPTTPWRGRQVVLSHRDPDGPGYALEIDPKGGLVLTLAGSAAAWTFATGIALEADRWWFVAAVVDRTRGHVRLVQRPVPEWPVESAAASVVHPMGPEVADGHAAAGTPLLMAAALAGPAPISAPSSGSDPLVQACLNGRLDRPRIFGAALGEQQLQALYDDALPQTVGAPVVAAWDFSLEISSDRVRDVGPSGLHGRTVNLPARAMTDHTWRGASLDWTADASGHGAIHFHDDDLADARWQVDFEVALPTTLPSGIYAVKLTAEPDPDLDPGATIPDAALLEDSLPFFVRPAHGAPTSDLLFLQSTNTHLAYANWHPALSEERALARGYVWPYPLPPGKLYAIEHSLLSLYDHHSDGSGVCYVSARQPIMNIRPTMNDELSADSLGYAHGVKADLHVAGWLAAKGIAYDVAADEDLHREGVELLARYRVVLTGTHPEYWTGEMLDAAQAYLAAGGRFIYLGGNGFYWVTSYDPERPHVIEVRRWGGSQAWTANAGEYHHSTTGELGGMWRERGRAPQVLTGVGFTAMGHGGAQPYRRTPASHDPRAAWIFEGVGDDELIGDDGLVMGGAAGFEMDRADTALGTPPHALVVASATGFSDGFQHVVEEVPTSNSLQGGTVEPRVRADIVFFETPGDGAVFSVGSISFGGSLSVNGYDNALARMTENVVRGFLQQGPLPRGG